MSRIVSNALWASASCPHLPYMFKRAVQTTSSMENPELAMIEVIKMLAFVEIDKGGAF